MMYHQTWQDSLFVLIKLWFFALSVLALSSFPLPIGIYPLAEAFSLSQPVIGLRPTLSTTTTTRLRPPTRSILSTNFHRECRSINKNHKKKHTTHYCHHAEYQEEHESCHVPKNLGVDTLLKQNVNNVQVRLPSTCDPSSLSSSTEQDDESLLVPQPSTLIPTGLEPWQEEELEEIFDEVLYRMAFVMEHEALAKTSNPAVREMFQTCLESVTIGNSTIPGAGRGLFATRDISPGTIVAFYPIHAIGCKFPSGSCSSVQIAERPEDMIQVEQSAYALYSLIERPLLGVDLRTRYHPPTKSNNSNNTNQNYPRLFVDMNPKAKLQDGWLCGLINDAGIVKYWGDVDYYRTSRGPKRNIEIVPFSHVAPFQVGVTTRHVQKGEELFVSYGYSYWASKIVPSGLKDHQEQPSSLARIATHHQQQQEQLDEIQRQEELASMEIAQWIQAVQDRYAVAAQGVAELFEGLDDLPVLAPIDTNTPDSARQEEQEPSSPRRQRRWNKIAKRLQQGVQKLVGPMPNLSKKLPGRLSPRLRLMFRRQ